MVTPWLRVMILNACPSVRLHCTEPRSPAGNKTAVSSIYIRERENALSHQRSLASLQRFCRWKSQRSLERPSRVRKLVSHVSRRARAYEPAYVPGDRNRPKQVPFSSHSIVSRPVRSRPSPRKSPRNTVRSASRRRANAAMSRSSTERRRQLAFGEFGLHGIETRLAERLDCLDYLPQSSARGTPPQKQQCTLNSLIMKLVATCPISVIRSISRRIKPTPDGKRARLSGCRSARLWSS